MVDVDNLSDAELRAKLIEFGFPVMPITGSTRKVMVKKLKLLLENKNKIGKDNRRSLGRYSSEDESDTETKKAAVKRLNKRQTIAAPLMQPPSTSRVATAKKSTTRFDNNETSPINTLNRPVEEKVVKTLTQTTRTTKILNNVRDEFDTGSESDEIADNYETNTSYNRKKDQSPIKVTTTRNTDSFSRVSSPSSVSSSGRLPSSFIAASTAAEQAAERLNQIRSRYSTLNTSSSATTTNFDKPLYHSSPAVDDTFKEKESTPFLSNFTKRLSQIQSESPKLGGYDYKSDIIKENDVNGSGGLARNYLNSYRASRGRPSVYDYQKQSNNSSIFKNNFVPLMVLIVALLFFVVIAVTYLGIRSDNPYEISATVPRCNAPNDPGKYLKCIMDDERTDAVDLFKILKPELNKRAVTNICINGKYIPYMTELEIVEYLDKNFAPRVLNYFYANYRVHQEYQNIRYTKNMGEMKIMNDLRNLEFLLFYNPNWGLSVIQLDKEGEEFHSGLYATDMGEVEANRNKKIIGLISSYPNIPWKCYIYNKISAVLNILTSIIGGVFILYIINYGYKQYKLFRQKQQDEEYAIVENIIDILQTNCTDNDNDNNFLVINHIRDMILPVHDRKNKEKIWCRAVKYINENESRIRTEIQNVRGEPTEVWRWLGGPNINISTISSNTSAVGGGAAAATAPSGSTIKNNSSWQGQAFGTQINSINCSPTPCLKIRGMVDEGDRNTHAIKQAVLNKCAQGCRILHCAVDTNTNCVYLKCADPADAAIAFRNLHGWWYSGNLVTVKYLRLERYMQRFPDSPVSGPPYLQ